MTDGNDDLRAVRDAPKVEAANRQANQARRAVFGWRTLAIIGTLVGLLVGGLIGRATAPSVATGGGPGGGNPVPASALIPDGDGHLDNASAMATFLVSQLHSKQPCTLVSHQRAGEAQIIAQDLVHIPGGAMGRTRPWGYEGPTPALSWDYSDKLTTPLANGWVTTLDGDVKALPLDDTAGCDSIVVLISPDWEGAVRADMDALGAVAFPMVLGADAYTPRFGDVCANRCGDGQAYSVVDMSHVYVWKSGAWQFFGPVPPAA